jgi:hypothetical protein
MVRCRSAGERFIPSMSCALTRILKDACGPQSRTAFLITLSRQPRDSRVTMHSLQFAQSVNLIRSRPDVGDSSVFDELEVPEVTISEQFRRYRETVGSLDLEEEEDNEDATAGEVSSCVSPSATVSQPPAAGAGSSPGAGGAVDLSVAQRINIAALSLSHGDGDPDASLSSALVQQWKMLPTYVPRN